MTQFLNNGEVGTPFYDQYVVENPTPGTVTFGSTSLPPGLALDPATGDRHKNWAMHEIDEALRILPTPAVFAELVAIDDRIGR